MEALRPDRDAPRWPLLLLIGAALLITLVQAGPALGGDLRGNDDLMRMQQVRDLLAGDRGWFDVSQKRLLTPEGGAMHWSRVPDVFIAGIVFLFQPLMGTARAESVAAILWPMFQLAWALSAVCICLRRLGATLSGQLAGIFFFCTSSALINFLPGRIDHHGLGLALTLTAFACLLSPTRSTRSAVIAGLCVPAMLTIAIENLPAAGFVLAAFGLAWIVRGEEETNRLRYFGATLVVAALGAYIFDAPGAGGARRVCDAYGQSHFVTLLVAGAGLFSIASFMSGTRDWRSRTVMMVIAGLAALVSFVAINPSCLSDPYTGLSDELRAGWLSRVAEARSLPGVFANDFAGGLYYYGFGFVGLGSAVAAVLISPKGRQLDRLLLAGICVVGFIVSLWQLRAAMVSHAFAAIACSLIVGLVFSQWLNRRGAKAALALFAAAILLSPVGWRLPVLIAPDAKPQEQKADCTSREAFRQVAAAPRMVVFTPIDLGAPLIYHTRHYATAAPYHRNSKAIERAVNIFSGPVASAHQKILRTGASHILFCPGQPEMAQYRTAAPGSLGAALEQGDIPDWLQRSVPEAGPEDHPVLYTVALERN